jgi:hypothetical protein
LTGASVAGMGMLLDRLLEILGRIHGGRPQAPGWKQVAYSILALHALAAVIVVFVWWRNR